MPGDDAKVELANIMMRKVGLIRTIRHYLRERQDIDLLGLEEIIEAVELARKEEERANSPSSTSRLDGSQ